MRFERISEAFFKHPCFLFSEDWGLGNGSKWPSKDERLDPWLVFVSPSFLEKPNTAVMLLILLYRWQTWRQGPEKQPPHQIQAAVLQQAQSASRQRQTQQSSTKVSRNIYLFVYFLILTALRRCIYSVSVSYGRKHKCERSRRAFENIRRFFREDEKRWKFSAATSWRSSANKRRQKPARQPARMPDLSDAPLETLEWVRLGLSKRRAAHFLFPEQMQERPVWAEKNRNCLVSANGWKTFF